MENFIAVLTLASLLLTSVVYCTSAPQLVVFGGRTRTSYAASVKVNAYDAETGTKTVLHDLPISEGVDAADNWGVSVGERNGKFFVAGGVKSGGRAWVVHNGAKDDTVPRMVVKNRFWPLVQWIDDDKVLVYGSQPSYEIYNTKTKTWNENAYHNLSSSVPHMRNPAGVVYNDRIYIVTGKNRNFVKYLKVTDKFEKLARTPVDVYGAGVAVFDHQLIVCGGKDRGNLNKATAVCKSYSFERQTWSDFAPMNTARARLAMAVAGGNLYAVGGWAMVDGNPVFYDTVENYNQETKTWVTMDYKIAEPLVSPTLIGVNSLLRLVTNFWYK